VTREEGFYWVSIYNAYLPEPNHVTVAEWDGKHWNAVWYAEDTIAEDEVTVLSERLIPPAPKA
jgi:hypothetical protein